MIFACNFHCVIRTILWFVYGRERILFNGIIIQIISKPKKEIENHCLVHKCPSISLRNATEWNTTPVYSHRPKGPKCQQKFWKPTSVKILFLNSLILNCSDEMGLLRMFSRAIICSYERSRDKYFLVSCKPEIVLVCPANSTWLN